MRLIRNFWEHYMAQYCINPPKMRFLIKLWWPLVTASECWSREQYEFGKNLLIPWWYHINKVYVWLICRDPYWFPPHGNPTDQNSIIKTIKVRGEADGRRVWLALIVMVRCCFWLKSFCWNDGCDQFIVIQSLIFSTDGLASVTQLSISLLVVNEHCSPWTNVVRWGWCFF